MNIRITRFPLCLLTLAAAAAVGLRAQTTSPANQAGTTLNPSVSGTSSTTADNRDEPTAVAPSTTAEPTTTPTISPTPAADTSATPAPVANDPTPAPTASSSSTASTTTTPAPSAPDTVTLPRSSVSENTTASAPLKTRAPIEEPAPAGQSGTVAVQPAQPEQPAMAATPAATPAAPVAATTTAGPQPDPVATSIRDASSDSRDQLAAQINQKIQSNQHLVMSRDQIKQLNGTAAAEYKVVTKDMHAAERRLQKSLKAAQKASGKEWDQARATLASDYEIYMKSVQLAQQTAANAQLAEKTHRVAE